MDGIPICAEIVMICGISKSRVILENSFETVTSIKELESLTGINYFWDHTRYGLKISIMKVVCVNAANQAVKKASEAKLYYIIE